MREKTTRIYKRRSWWPSRELGWVMETLPGTEHEPTEERNKTERNGMKWVAYLVTKEHRNETEHGRANEMEWNANKII